MWCSSWVFCAVTWWGRTRSCSTAYWPVCCKVKTRGKRWLRVNVREAAFSGQIWIPHGFSPDGWKRISWGCWLTEVVKGQNNLSEIHSDTRQRHPGRVWGKSSMCAFEYVGMCFANDFLLYVQGAAGRMQSFAVRSPYRKRESLPLQCPLFLKEVCDIVLCAVQTQWAMALTADVLFLLSFYLG